MLLYLISCWYLLSVGIICYQESKVGWPITPYRKLIPFTMYHLLLATLQLLYILPTWCIIAKEYRASFVWDQISLNFRLLFPIWWGKIKWKNVENIPDQPCIWIGNHQSVLDMAIMSMLPCNTSMVGTSKDSIKYIFGSGILALMCETILVKRGHPSSREDFYNNCKKVLDNGKSINIFPQGTRQHENKGKKPLKKGAFVLACNTGIPILPYSINYKPMGITVTFHKTMIVTDVEMALQSIIL
jgi:1-acyl-sn-glycerol-3-phosphate acyltransferase